MAITHQQDLSKNYSSPSILTKFKLWASLSLGILFWRIRVYLTTNPKYYIRIFGLLRAISPILVLFKVILVTKHEDVTAVLSRDADFTLAEFSEERMIAGSFLLNIDWPEQHQRESSVVRKAIRSSDVDRIRAIAQKRCKAVISEARLEGNEIDVARQLAERVAIAVIEEYFGIRDLDNDARAKLVEWLRDLASAILALPPIGTSARIKIEQSAQEIFKLTKVQVENRAKEIEQSYSDWSEDPAGENDDDVLTRLIKLMIEAKKEHRDVWLNQDWVRRMIAGLMIFANATIARAATDAIDELLTRPQIFAEASKVSLQKDQNNSRSTIKQFVYEALRFRPMLPILARYSPRAAVIASGSSRWRQVPAGATLVAPPIAAMFDPRVFREPRQFKIDRPLESYLVFGAGMHQCTGQQIADIELVEIVTAVMQLPGLNRSPGRRGRIQYEGPAAKSLFLTFTNNSSGGK